MGNQSEVKDVGGGSDQSHLLRRIRGNKWELAVLRDVKWMKAESLPSSWVFFLEEKMEQSQVD